MERNQTSLLNSGLYLATLGITVLFSLSMDMIATRLIDQRNEQLIEAIAHFENPSAADREPSPSPQQVMPVNPDQGPNAFPHRARAILMESMRIGVYRPPRF